MTLRSWIVMNRPKIDARIFAEIEKKSGVSARWRPNDNDRRLWVLGFEPLYVMARRAGAKL